MVADAFMKLLPDVRDSGILGWDGQVTVFNWQEQSDTFAAVGSRGNIRLKTLTYGAIRQCPGRLLKYSLISVRGKLALLPKTGLEPSK